MKKILLLLLCVLSFNAIHADVTWNLSDDGTLTISGTGVMPNYYNGSDAPWYFQRGVIKNVVIENGVTSIGERAFMNCSSLTSVTIPKSVTSIGYCAFDGCSGLTSITIPNSVTSIGKEAFEYCSSLTSVTIPNSVTSIRQQAFYGCSKLTSVTIPNSVTDIEKYAFSGCKGLTSITIPNSVTSIGEFAFKECSRLISITIPKSVTSIGEAAFNACSNLISIKVEEDNPKYDSRNNCNAIIESRYNTLHTGCKNTTIPNSVKNIGGYAFSGNISLTSITIPNSVTSIGEYAFHSCSKLISITIPSSVTNIGGYAFTQCSSLISITIPNSVTSIGEKAFYGCSYLTSITCEAITPPACHRDCFFYVNKSIPVYVPANSINAYKDDDEWMDFTNIQAIPGYSLTDGTAYTNNSQINGRDIIYTRNFNNTNWQALYIPFSLKYDDWKDDFEVAYINGVRQLDKDDNGTIDETIMDVIKIKSGSTTPNMPYLIKAKTTGENTFSVSDATIYPAEENSVDCSTTIAKYTFTGTYNTIPSATMIANKYYAMGGGQLITSDGSNDLKPYRWYMKVESRNPSYNASNAAKTITINVLDEESETTGVEELQMANDESPVYDLNGRKVNENNLKPGIYVKNGKKFIVK